MSATFFLVPTEPTTDSRHAVVLDDPTSSHGHGGVLAFGSVTLSDEFTFDAEWSTADRPLLQVFRSTAADVPAPRTEHVWIEGLGEAGYRILQPIPVVIERVGIGDVVASFREANIAMSGDDTSDAYQALVAEILDTFDVLLSEPSLGVGAAEQRRILCKHIARA